MSYSFITLIAPDETIFISGTTIAIRNIESIKINSQGALLSYKIKNTNYQEPEESKKPEEKLLKGEQNVS